MFAMEVRPVARMGEGDIEKDHFLYGPLDEAEKQAFIKYLENLDFSAARNDKLERGLRDEAEKIISAVKAGVTDNESLLWEARSYYYYFAPDKAAALSA
ncbi:MAG: hypothetical protein PHF50_02225 [Patescibacteria group bacterium]|nr:hypothetical protein [Patescibacteria group bacterium]